MLKSMISGWNSLFDVENMRAIVTIFSHISDVAVLLKFYFIFNKNVLVNQHTLQFLYFIADRDGIVVNQEKERKRGCL